MTTTPIAEADLSHTLRPETAINPSRSGRVLDACGTVTLSARYRAARLRDWIVEILLAAFRFFGPIECSMSTVRRGYFGAAARCRVCRNDVHDIGEMCSQQKTAQCDICGPVLMDYYGCPIGGREISGTHRIVGNVHPTTEAEWLRMRRQHRARRAS